MAEIPIWLQKIQTKKRRDALLINQAREWKGFSAGGAAALSTLQMGRSDDVFQG